MFHVTQQNSYFFVSQLSNGVKITVLWRQNEIIINTSDQFSHLQMSPLLPLFRSTCLLQVTMMARPAKTWKQEVQYFFSKMEKFVKIKESKWDLNSTREGAIFASDSFSIAMPPREGALYLIGGLFM